MKFALTRDVNGYNGFGLQPSDKMFAANLTQLIGQTLTVPSDAFAYIAIFTPDPGLRCYVSYNELPTIPPLNFAQTTSELNPVARRVLGGDVLHFITPDVNCNITVVFYALSENPV
jgi:hypothetical protein